MNDKMSDVEIINRHEQLLHDSICKAYPPFFFFNPYLSSIASSFVIYIQNMFLNS